MIGSGLKKQRRGLNAHSAAAHYMIWYIVFSASSAIGTTAARKNSTGIAIMAAAKIKEILALVNIAGLLAGGGTMLAGCSADRSPDADPAESIQKESGRSEKQDGINQGTGEIGPAGGKKIRGKSG